MAIILNELYGYLDYLGLQTTPYTSTGEYLSAWGALKGVVKIPATYAQATQAIQLNGIAGSTIPLGTNLTRPDGFIYTTTAQLTLPTSGVGYASVIASQTGPIGNCAVGVTVTLTNGITGVQVNGSVAVAISGGSDLESDSSYRTRMLQRYQQPPQGGSINDYIGWTLSVSGVTRAWIIANNAPTPGSVIVYPMLDLSDVSNSGFPLGTNGVSLIEGRWPIKATGDQGRIAAYLATVQDATDLVFVTAPLQQVINFTFTNLSPNTAVTQAAITVALQSLLLSIGTPLIGTITLSQLYQAILAAGNITFNLISPNSTITTALGYLPVVGTITFPATTALIINS